MKFSFDVGNKEKSQIDFYRNWFTGRVDFAVNGEKCTLVDPMDIRTHFSIKKTEGFRFTVGDQEQHEVLIEKKRPLIFPGLRRQKYAIFVDGSLVEEYEGF
ncbi:MAG: hypothetical protein ACNA8H_01800 [Anaerolineales bacterium]